MAFRRKRRTRSTWFPVLGQEIAGGGSGLNPDGFDSHFTGGIHHAAGAGNYEADVIPLTWDYPADTEVTAFDQAPSLADWQGSAWQLDGIKGAVRVNIVPKSNGQGGLENQIIRAAAYAEVLRVNPSDGSPLDDLADYSTFLAENRRDPYIWQRSWLLESPTATLVAASQVVAFFPPKYPVSNVYYEGRDTGSCIDTKSRRYIGTDERLFMCVEAVLINKDGDFGIDAGETVAGWDLQYDIDVRVIGRLRKATNRRNASR